MRDYLSDFLTPGGGENLKTLPGGKAQKAQKSLVTFENAQRGQGSKGSKGTFDTFDTSPPKGFSKIQMSPIVEKMTKRPPLGSIARPVVCRGAGMLNYCPWNTCDGRISGQGGNLYLCADCATWFELLPLNMGVYAETEWAI